MRRLSALLLIIVVFAFGTGVLEYVHDLQHAREDAAEAAAAVAAGQTPMPHPEHDENNCPMHAQLHMLVIVTGFALLLLCTGRAVPFAAWEPLQSLAVVFVARPSCRDPPVVLVCA